MISTIILTLNEECSIEDCLKSLSWCDDVHVVDSGSTDKTIDICRQYKACIHSNPFKTFAQQRNWAIDNCGVKFDWILFLDADERSTRFFASQLYESISSVKRDVAGFYCCWMLMLGEKWLKRSDSFPKWQLRVLKKGFVRYIDVGHGQKEGEVLGNLEYINEPYEHYAFLKGWNDWIQKHNRYSKQEARERFYSNAKFVDIFNKNPSKRNIILKSLLTRVPIWPLIRFLHAYLFKLGFLEGREGLVYCLNMFFYEYMISLKYFELKKRAIKHNYYQ